MHIEYELNKTEVKFDRAGRTWPVSIGIDDKLIRYLFSVESTTRTPFGALAKFLEDDRVDAVVAYAAMYCERKHLENMELDEEEEEKKPYIRGPYKPRKRIPKQEDNEESESK